MTIQPYFKIGEVAKIADIPSHVLRYWESEFPAITPKRTRSGQRLYRQGDINLILQIQDLLHQRGFTIAGARKVLETPPQLPATSSQISAERPESFSKNIDRLQELKRELHDLKKLLDKS